MTAAERSSVVDVPRGRGVYPWRRGGGAETGCTLLMWNEAYPAPGAQRCSLFSLDLGSPLQYAAQHTLSLQVILAQASCSTLPSTAWIAAMQRDKMIN